MLRLIRIVLAILSLLAVTLLFVDFTGTAAGIWPWMAKIQFVPALLSVNLVALTALLLLTFVFGRIYCSVICPLGIFQDVADRIRRWTVPKKRKKPYKYEKPRSKTRIVFLSIFIVMMIIGLLHGISMSIAGLLDPYSVFGRIASRIAAPAYDAGNNLLVAWSESRADNYLFYRVTYAISLPVLIVAVISLIIILVFVWRGGRSYCNTVCPVGTILGFISRKSLFKPVIETEKCVRCGKCARYCKSKCIDAKNHEIDYSRCVVCMDCIGACKERAIKYKFSGFGNKKDIETVDKTRRGFMTGASMVAGALASNAVAKHFDGGLAPLKDKKPHTRTTTITPPGSVSAMHLSRHCTACQLCIQSCPGKILKPTIDLDGFMQPYIDYTDGYCHTSCTRCSNICPDGAFHPLDKAEKASVKIGSANVDLCTCISAAYGRQCGKCAQVCPAGAVQMARMEPDNGQSHLMPVVNNAICIGCGKCEYYCPVGKVEGSKGESSAIYVEGLDTHRII